VLHVRSALAYFDGILRWACQAFADRILVNAEALKDQVFPPFRSRCFAIHDGVETPKRWMRSEARRELTRRLGVPLDEHDRLVLSLSSFVPFKGLHYLIEAAGMLGDGAPRGTTTFLLAGSTPDDRYKTYLETRKAQIPFANVRLLGYFSDPELLTVAADLLVLPTVDETWFDYPDGERVRVRSTEGLPQAILEALAAGVPVVATRVAGTPEQVRHGETGFLVPQSDTEALATAIGVLLRDADLRLRMGEAARADAVTRFDARTQALRTLELLHQAAA
jgi:glycosyltransferase involved in cell wall biosynthesis